MIEPILIPAGDNRVLLNGRPPKVDCRVLSEETYQEMLEAYVRLTNIKSAMNTELLHVDYISVFD